MKKTLFAILAFAGLAQVSFADAYYTKNDFDASSGSLNLFDVASTFSSDTFAISFELDKSLTDINSSTEFFSFVLGGSSTYRVDIASMEGFLGHTMTMSAGNKAEFVINPPNTSGPFVLQMVANGSATLLYNNGGSLEQIMQIDNPPYSIPNEIKSANIIFNDVKASEVTTWTGVVTAEDLANPTPAPSVPEPTTATLSLLALVGLAARRRRR